MESPSSNKMNSWQGQGKYSYQFVILNNYRIHQAWRNIQGLLAASMQCQFFKSESLEEQV